MEKVGLPRFSERIIGITLPVDGRMFVCDHDEVYELNLDSAQANITGQDPRVFMEENWTLGISDEKPITTVGLRHISYEFDEQADSVTVNTDVDGVLNNVEFPIDSGDWFVGSISKCGNFIVLAEPYDLWVYRIN